MNAMDSDTETDRLLQLRDEPGGSRQGWRMLFFFMKRKHLITATFAIIFSIVGAVVFPFFAIAIGNMFDVFSGFGSGQITADAFSHHVIQNVYYLVLFAAAVWITKGASFIMWHLYGEQQAISARDTIFCQLLDKEVAWFDVRGYDAAALAPTVSR